MKKGLLGLLILLGLGYVAASPYITVWQMSQAADRRDGEALSAHVEFPTLRQNLKDQINVIMAREVAEGTDENPLAVLGAAFAGALIEPVVDAYVTPAALAELMRGVPPEEAAEGEGERSRMDAGDDESFTNASLAYVAWDRFRVTVATDAGEDVIFILERRGLGWKLTNVILPTNP